MTKNKGGFREAIVIKRKMKDAQAKIDSLLVYMIKNILDEEYIFITSTDDIIYAVMEVEGLEVGVLEVQGKEVEVGDKSGNVEKLYMMKKDDSLKRFMNDKGVERDFSKLIGLMIKERCIEKNEGDKLGITVIIVALDKDEEFNFRNVGNTVLRIFPRFSSKKNLDRLQKDMLNMIMVDSLIRTSVSKKKKDD